MTARDQHFLDIFEIEIDKKTLTQNETGALHPSLLFRLYEPVDKGGLQIDFEIGARTSGDLPDSLGALQAATQHITTIHQAINIVTAKITHILSHPTTYTQEDTNTATRIQRTIDSNTRKLNILIHPRNYGFNSITTTSETIRQANE